MKPTWRNKVINALVLATAVFGSVSLLSNLASAADEKPKDKVSSEIVKPLKAAQDLTNDKKYPEAIAKLKEAEAYPKKTPYDEHVINQLAAVAYIRGGDLAGAEKAFEALLNDGMLDPSEVPVRLKGLAQINYQLKDYDKAVQYGERAIKEGHEDDDIDVIVGQAYYVKNDYAGSVKFQQELLDREVKANRTPSEQSLKCGRVPA
jgi:tetratricopeptide (TPR) repeat protein